MGPSRESPAGQDDGRDQGERPEAVIVVATETEPDGSRETVTRRATLAGVEEA